jgi:hypothetical protein
MKKTFTVLTTALIILASFKAKAQDTKEYVKSYISFLGGKSIPLSNYGQSNYNNNSAGFAKKGMVLGLEGAYYFYKNLGFVATVSYQDQGELSQNDVQTLSDGYNTSFHNNFTTLTAVNRYNNLNILGGPQYSFVYHKFTLDLKAIGGLIKSYSTPSIQIQYTNGNNSLVTLSQNSSKSSAFAYGGGAGLRYSLGEHWDVNLRGNYIESGGIKISNSNNDGKVGRFVTKQPVTEIQTTLGISLHL